MAFEIRAHHLWDGKMGRTGPVSVGVEGDRVRSVGKDFAPAAAGGAEVLDFDDATILPGLIDMHTHLGINHQTGDIRAQMKDPAVRHILAAVQSLRTDLESGVTTAKLNGDREFYDVQMRDAIREGSIPGPRLFVSGRGIKSSHCTGGVVATAIVDDAETVGRCVDANLAAGADWIKLFSSGGVFGPLEDALRPSYGFSQLSVAAAKAHAAGKRMSSHCFGGEAADACIEAGVDVMDHGWLLTERQLEAMAKRGIWLCPTVGVLTHPAGTLKHFPEGPDREEARRALTRSARLPRRPSESACRSWPAPMRCTENWPMSSRPSRVSGAGRRHSSGRPRATPRRPWGLQGRPERSAKGRWPILLSSAGMPWRM